MNMKGRKLVAAGLVVLVFIAGVVVGAVFHQLLVRPTRYDPPRPPSPEYIVTVFKERLSLDDQQVEKVHWILRKTHKEVFAQSTKCLPDLKRSIKRVNQQIRDILRDDQVQRFDKMVAEWEEMNKKLPGPPGPGGPIPPPQPPR